ASQIADDPEVLVIGSQSVLGATPEHRLPPAATASLEVDIAFFDDPDDRKADQVDGATGELSPFHETFGYYAQGRFAPALIQSGWFDPAVLPERIETVDVVPAGRQRPRNWISSPRG